MDQPSSSRAATAAEIHAAMGEFLTAQRGPEFAAVCLAILSVGTLLSLRNQRRDLGDDYAANWVTEQAALRIQSAADGHDDCASAPPRSAVLAAMKDYPSAVADIVARYEVILAARKPRILVDTAAMKRSEAATRGAMTKSMNGIIADHRARCQP